MRLSRIGCGAYLVLLACSDAASPDDSSSGGEGVGGSSGEAGASGAGASGAGASGAGASGAGGGASSLDPLGDEDEDGLSNGDEVDRHGTSPYTADTDGDGFSDFDEIVTYAFDPDTRIAQFNPRVADVPALAVRLVSAPNIGVVYTEESGTEQTSGTERTDSTSTSETASWGGSNSHSVEMTHTAGVEVGVQHEIGLFPSTSVDVTLSYEFSHSTTNESTVSWSNDQTTENSQALARIESLQSSETVSVTDGYVQVAVEVVNQGHIAYALEGLTLTAYTRASGDAFEVSPVGTLQFLDGANTFPRTVLEPGESEGPFVFEARVGVATARALLADSTNLVIGPATRLLSGPDGESFELAATGINARTAEVIIDYGLDRPIESYRVATNAAAEGSGVTVETALTDYLRVPYETGSIDWRHGSENAVRPTFTGLSALRGVGSSAVDSTYWLVSHTRSRDSGAGAQTDHYNLLRADYDLGAIVLEKGDVLHLVRVEDPDRDGLGARSEFLHGTSPTIADTDDDGLSDSHEVAISTIELEGDAEYQVTTDPLLADGDGDGLSDGQEVNGWLIDVDGASLRVYSHPGRVDTDGDGIRDADEYAGGSHPGVVDLAAQCKDLYQRGTRVSGTYRIDPRPGVLDPFEVHCDMANHGGGWTRVTTDLIRAHGWLEAIPLGSDRVTVSDQELVLAVGAGTVLTANVNLPFTFTELYGRFVGAAPRDVYSHAEDNAASPGWGATAPAGDGWVLFGTPGTRLKQGAEWNANFNDGATALWEQATPATVAEGSVLRWEASQIDAGEEEHVAFHNLEIYVR